MTGLVGDMMDDYFMGLDLSLTGAACVVLDSEGKEVSRNIFGYSLGKDASVKSKLMRIIKIASGIVSVAKGQLSDGSMQVGIEGYAFRAVGRQNDLAELQGVVKTQLFLALKLVSQIVVATSARKKVLGKGKFSKGKAGKKEIMAACGGLGFCTDDDNMADAYVIAECLRLGALERTVK